MSVSLTGDDLIKIDDRTLSDFGNGEVVNLEFPNNVVEVTRGKNGSGMYPFNSPGMISTVTLRVLLGSADDKYLNARFREYLNDPPSFVLIRGLFVKRAGDGRGGVTNVSYRMRGGIIQTFPNAVDNQEGGEDQAVSVWNLQFVTNNRNMA